MVSRGCHGKGRDVASERRGPFRSSDGGASGVHRERAYVHEASVRQAYTVVREQLKPCQFAARGVTTVPNLGGSIRIDRNSMRSVRP